ncbi:MAG: DUF1648 domain-containing protein [Flavobacterium sp.]
MSKRPIVTLTFTKADRVLEYAGYVLWLLFWGMVIWMYPFLPEEIPIHFNGVGEADGFGSKDTIFLTPIIATFLVLLLSVLERNPENFNYTVEITEENAPRQYLLGVRMMRWMKLLLIFLFMAIDYFTMQVSLGKREGLGAWFLPVTLGILFIVIAVTIYESKKKK